MVALPLPNLPEGLSDLRDLALDLRWTWNHETDTLWKDIDPALWERSRNPWSILQGVPPQVLQRLASDHAFREKLAEFVAARRRYLKHPGWFVSAHGTESLKGVAYFSMEFGLGAALPLYAGGLGVLAGDYLKTASDLAAPVIGIGLLYQEGYFRQIVDTEGMQQELYPYNEPASLPIAPVISDEGGWLRIQLEFPGRPVQLRVWKAQVGRVPLYLLDSNDPLNSPADRGITAKLYGGGSEIRLMQEIVLGIAGWRVVKALHPDTEICHINEGHAAFAIIERARQCAVACGMNFHDGFWATRAGNVFTTHTPVAAGFDAFPAALLCKYLPYAERDLQHCDIATDDLVALGRLDPDDADEPFNMAYLAQRGSATTLGVSRLHGEFSRRIFQPLFPRWPDCEVPVGHVTNGVHIPTWDSPAADRLWTEACGKERWREMPDALAERVGSLSDESLWAMRGEGRQRLVATVRHHMAAQLRERGAEQRTVSEADTVLDPNILTLGFARRFTEYKRPNLLLRDTVRLGRLLTDAQRPMQIVVAGKAHPADSEGKAMIRAWIELARDPRYRRHVVFLEDYDIAVAQELVQGVDLWINTPRRPWEACGTSGMKVLVNGGINCSILDGWWDEAFRADAGWAIGDDKGGEANKIDARDAESLYSLLETRIVPEFYDRDAEGLPRRWLGRVRRSTATLTPLFASTRMFREYVEDAYLPLTQLYRERGADACAKARGAREWADNLARRWPGLQIEKPTIAGCENRWRVSVPVFLGEIPPKSVQVQLFANVNGEKPAEAVVLHQEHKIPGALNGYIYAGEVPVTRPADDYTVRIVPFRDGVQIPAELPLIAWQR
ncbi:MAG: alpha-glucan family phosphorylase [Alphaproteobacteria bacterium]|nr:alpha-glucan family phosphorylase [Alphaproteobacteria bacterium]